MAEQNAVIISAFACSGKSFLTKNSKTLTHLTNRPVVDLDSSAFSFLRDGKRNPNFVRDYLGEIQRRARERIILLVSTHPEVRDGLKRAGLRYALVYPRPELKAEWLQRMRDRRSPPQLVAVFDKNWEDFVSQCNTQRGCEHFPLAGGKYLADVLAPILRYFGNSGRA